MLIKFDAHLFFLSASLQNGQLLGKDVTLFFLCRNLIASQVTVESPTKSKNTVVNDDGTRKLPVHDKTIPMVTPIGECSKQSYNSPTTT